MQICVCELTPARGSCQRPSAESSSSPRNASMPLRQARYPRDLEVGGGTENALSGRQGCSRERVSARTRFSSSGSTKRVSCSPAPSAMRRHVCSQGVRVTSPTGLAPTASSCSERARRRPTSATSTRRPWSRPIGALASDSSTRSHCASSRARPRRRRHRRERPAGRPGGSTRRRSACPAHRGRGARRSRGRRPSGRRAARRTVRDGQRARFRPAHQHVEVAVRSPEVRPRRRPRVGHPVVDLADELDAAGLKMRPDLTDVVDEDARDRMLEEVVVGVGRLEDLERAAVRKPEDPPPACSRSSCKPSRSDSNAVMASSCGLLEPSHETPRTLIATADPSSGCTYACI